MCKSIKNKEKSVILEIKNASYTYDGETDCIWRQLSCQFYKGKIHAIAGASGCGKSSILYLLNGLIPHMLDGNMEGSVWFEGSNITDELPRYRCNKIGLVMQNPESQFCTFTVEEELAFGMENLCLPTEKMQERIKKTLDYIGMSGYEKRDLNQLSGGQKQKIAIASILVMEPEVLLLDEPTANLDPNARREVLTLLTRLAREQNKTIILVEHNLDEIMEEVDYFYRMNGKRELLLVPSKDEIRNIVCQSRSDEGNSKVTQEINKEETHVQSKDEPQERKKEYPVILELSDVKFSYPQVGRKHGMDKTWILNGIDLSIKEKDFLAIVGENGAGKSTLLRVIFQINQQNEGKIQFYGKPIEGYKKKELYRQIGLVFQNPENQFISNSVMDELLFSLKKERMSQQEKEKRVLQVLQQFHLEEHKDKSPFVLSQGQKRRLSVATMLLTGQKLLFLDEPTYGQDFENRHELMRDLQKLNEAGKTIVMITHDLSLVKEYAKRVVELTNGTISLDLSIEKYLERLRPERRE